MTRPQRGPSHCSACGAGPLRTVRLLNLCAGCLDVMHDLRVGLSDHEHAVLLALLERMRAGSET